MNYGAPLSRGRVLYVTSTDEQTRGGECQAGPAWLGHCAPPSLRGGGPGQSLAVVLIPDVQEPGALFRKPTIADAVFQCAAVTIHGPRALIENCKMAEFSAAVAAGIGQTRAASRGPIEHLYLEVMC